jgi:hypothetical protein
MIYVAIPTYNGLIHHSTVGGLLEVQRFLTENRVGFAVDVIPHDAFIGRARNMAAKRFLASGATDLIYIDADVGFRAKDFGLLMRQDVDICCGLYPYKKDEVAFPCLVAEPQERVGPRVRLVYGPTGFMRIRRKVFESIQRANPGNFYRDDIHVDTYEFFPFGRRGNEFMGEDVGFCRLATERGFKIWGVEGMELQHTGERTWSAQWQPAKT